jgi:DNA replication protein DnaC
MRLIAFISHGVDTQKIQSYISEHRQHAEVSAELLQAIVHQFYKLRRSMVVTSNRVPQGWGTYLGDTTMGSTILDRHMHRAHMLDFGGESYRHWGGCSSIVNK